MANNNIYDIGKLSAIEQLILIAKEEFGISYGLRFRIPEDAPHSVRNINGLKVRDYEETPSGETILRTIAVRANDLMVEKQNSFMFESAAKLYAEWPDAFEDFEQAYASLSKVPDTAMKFPGLILEYRNIQRQASKEVSQYVEHMRLVSDLIFCYFLTLHTDRVWELEDIYSLGDKTKLELTEFMAEQIGLKTLAEDDESLPEALPDEGEDKENLTTPVAGKSRGSSDS